MPCAPADAGCLRHLLGPLGRTDRELGASLDLSDKSDKSDKSDQGVTGAREPVFVWSVMVSIASKRADGVKNNESWAE